MSKRLLQWICNYKTETVHTLKTCTHAATQKCTIFFTLIILHRYVLYFYKTNFRILTFLNKGYICHRKKCIRHKPHWTGPVLNLGKNWEVYTSYRALLDGRKCRYYFSVCWTFVLNSKMLPETGFSKLLPFLLMTLK
jgi:hypothetical protein